MTAWLEGHIHGCGPRPLPGRTQCNHFGVRPTGTNVKPLTDHTAVIHDNATYGGIGGAGTQASCRQAQGAAHVTPVDRGGAIHFFFRRVSFNNGN